MREWGFGFGLGLYKSVLGCRIYYYCNSHLSLFFPISPIIFFSNKVNFYPGLKTQRHCYYANRMRCCGFNKEDNEMLINAKRSNTSKKKKKKKKKRKRKHYLTTSRKEIFRGWTPKNLKICKRCYHRRLTGLWMCLWM